MTRIKEYVTTASDFNTNVSNRMPPCRCSRICTKGIWSTRITAMKPNRANCAIGSVAHSDQTSQHVRAVQRRNRNQVEEAQQQTQLCRVCKKEPATCRANRDHAGARQAHQDNRQQQIHPGPAIETRMSSRRGLRRLEGFTGTGLAQPTRNRASPSRS